MVDETGLHEPIIHFHVNGAELAISLCDNCDTCKNTACYDLEKLRKH